VAGTQLQVSGTPVGIPLMYEGLALYYNVDILNTAVVQPPKTWSEVQTAARTLTVTENGVVKRAGIALGNATNVEHFSDIVALLMLQNGADFAHPNSPETRDALLFYTKFLKDDFWSESLPNSSVAFARGDVAMMFAPSWRAHEIKQMNPSLNFATVSVPQLSGDAKFAWANYWAEGVSVKGKHQKEAWQFLKYLSSKDVQQKIYAAQAETRSFGEIYSRIDAADSLVADKVVGAYVLDAPKASGWYMSSYTHDAGINDEIIEYYADAVTGILSGKGTEEVLQTLESGVKQVLQKYGVSTTGSTSEAI
jgi:multiple sugar transport system substrate-binding protein